jgi:uncharacterized membrane protein YdbT with pleckstrin-like domain
MSYIEKNLLPDEQITYRAKLHWIIYAPAVMLLVPGILLIVLGAVRHHTTALLVFGIVIVVVSLFLALPAWIRQKTSEFGVTNKRVLIKIGFIRRHSLEILLQKVEGIGVDQGIPGRVFSYGTIVVTGTGGTRESFAKIADPLAFRRHIQERISAMSTSP